MRVVFAGTADFAVPSLRALTTAHDVITVVTQPDRPGSRGRPAPRPVADLAGALGIPVLQPARIRAPESVDAILGLHPDVLVVAAYGQIIPVALLGLIVWRSSATPKPDDADDALPSHKEGVARS